MLSIGLVMELSSATGSYYSNNQIKGILAKDLSD